MTLRDDNSLGVDLGRLTVQHTVDVKRLLPALLEGDDIGAVLRCHHEAEAALNHVLERLTGGRSKRKAAAWMFAQRLEVCHLLGFHENWTIPLKIHNDQRNAFAHRGVTDIDEQHVLDLYHQVRKLYPGLEDSFRVTVSGERPYDKTYGEASLRERYVMCMMIALSLFAAIPEMETGLRNGSIRPVSS